MYNTAFSWLMMAEGGEVNHAADKGGHTKFGIADAADGKKDGLADLDRNGTGDVPIANLTREQASQFYFDHYWLPSRCQQVSRLHAPLALALFDTAVHSGPGRAIKLLQAALGVAVDGSLGPKTLEAVADRARINRGTPLLLAFLEQRSRFLLGIVASDPSQAVFASGWMNRLLRLQSFLLTYTGAWE